MTSLAGHGASRLGVPGAAAKTVGTVTSAISTCVLPPVLLPGRSPRWRAAAGSDTVERWRGNGPLGDGQAAVSSSAFSRIHSSDGPTAAATCIDGEEAFVLPPVASMASESRRRATISVAGLRRLSAMLSAHRVSTCTGTMCAHNKGRGGTLDARFVCSCSYGCT